MSSETLYLEVSSAGISSERDSSAEVLFDFLCQFAGYLGLQRVILARNDSTKYQGSLDRVVKLVGRDISNVVAINGSLHELSQQQVQESNPLPVNEHISVTVYPDSPAPEDLALLAEDFLVEVADSVKEGKYTRLIHGPHGVRVTHLPTGTAVECNAVDISNKKDEAIRMLVARLAAIHIANTEPGSIRAIRKYVFPKHALLHLHSNTFSQSGKRNAP